jgi:hypothetical protein
VESTGRTLASAFPEDVPVQVVVEIFAYVEGAGWAVSFEIVWPTVDPEACRRVVGAVRSYKGQMEWAAGDAFNQRGVGVSAYPTSLADPLTRLSPTVSQEDLKKEIADFARYLGARMQSLRLRSPGPPTPVDWRVAHGASAYDPYLVRDPGALAYDEEGTKMIPTSEDDRRLYVALPDADLDKLSREPGTRESGGGELSDFVSSLLDRYSRIAIDRHRVAPLKHSLEEFSKELRDPSARRAIESLVGILEQARLNEMGVVLEPTR